MIGVMALIQCSAVRVIVALLVFPGESSARVPMGLVMQPGPSRPEIAGLLQQAEAGDAEAQYQVGSRFAGGQGVTHDDGEALKWWLKAAAQGHPLSQWAVGIFYREGRGGLAKSAEEAVAWFRKAANQGNAWGQAELALMYETGEGVPQDNAEAVRLYTRAADQGLPIAIFDLAYMYENGKGVSADSEKAVKLYELSAISIPTARRNLAILYSEGQGTVRKDPIVAYKWGCSQSRRNFNGFFTKQPPI